MSKRTEPAKNNWSGLAQVTVMTHGQSTTILLTGHALFKLEVGNPWGWVKDVSVTE